ncbi:DNA primase [Bacillus phage vB_BceM-HSE3]|nr:DNA primase [Bacillus phage vB_BceM-HSE3]
MFGTDYQGDGSQSAEISFCCPFCESRRGKPDTDYKMYVNIAKLKYWCFKCEAKGNLAPKGESRKALLQGSSEALASLVDYFDQKREEELELEDDGSNQFLIPTQKLRPGSNAYQYMIDRGVRHEDIEFYDMREGSLSHTLFFGRVVIPNVVTHNIFTDMFVARGYLHQEKRYLNPSASHKTEVVFNLHRIPQNVPDITICEGCISGIFTGRTCVATYGKYVAKSQMRMILNKKPQALYVSLDPDAREQALKLCSDIVGRTSIPLYQIDMPEGMDPADLGYEGFQEYKRSAKRYQSKLFFDMMDLFDKKKSKKGSL